MTDGVLDGVTAALGASTVLMALATRSLAKNSSRTLQAEREPLVIADTRDADHHSNLPTEFQSHALVSSSVAPGFPVAHQWTEGQTTWLVVRIRNAGRGAAVIKDALYDAWIDLDGRGIIYGESSAVVFAPSDTGYLVFADQPNVSTHYSMSVWLNQTDCKYKICLRYFDIDRLRAFQLVVECVRHAGIPAIMKIENDELTPLRKWWWLRRTIPTDIGGPNRPRQTCESVEAWTPTCSSLQGQSASCQVRPGLLGLLLNVRETPPTALKSLASRCRERFWLGNWLPSSW
jgi:hypothetical protein